MNIAKLLAITITLSLGFCHSLPGLEIIGPNLRESNIPLGGRFEGEIKIGNNEDRDINVKVYLTDYRFQADGSTEFPQPGTNPRSNAAWMELDGDQFVISTKTNAIVHYRGVVPRNGLRGTYWSVVMVEGVEPIVSPLAAVGATVRQIGIRTTIRHAIQIITEIGEPEPVTLKVKKPFLTRMGTNAPIYEMEVANPGDWMIWPDVSMQLFDVTGTPKEKLSAQKIHLFPGCSHRYRFSTAGLTAGKYDALIMFDAGKDSLTGARYEIVVPK